MEGHAGKDNSRKSDYPVSVLPHLHEEVPVMKQMSSYPVRISRSADIRKTLSATAGIYRRAVDFFISVCMEEWGHRFCLQRADRESERRRSLYSKDFKTENCPLRFREGFLQVPVLPEACGHRAGGRKGLLL